MSALLWFTVVHSMCNSKIVVFNITTDFKHIVVSNWLNDIAIVRLCVFIIAEHAEWEFVGNALVCFVELKDY